MSETANLNVDSETGSLELMGSGLDSISCLRKSSIGETAYTGSGDPPCAAPTCSELRETVNSGVNTSVSEMGNFDFMNSGNELRRCDDVLWKGRPSQCRSFWLHRFEIVGDCEFESQHIRLLGKVVHECRT